MELENLLYLITLIIITFLVFKTSKKIVRYVVYASFGVIILLTLSGCSGGNLDISNDMENVEDNTLLRVKDIPFLSNSKIDIEKSLILGEGRSWSGQIILNVPEPKPVVFNFYVKNIGDFGWKEQTTIRGETSILNYVGENNRVVIITVKEAMFGKSEVLISVSPFTEEFQEKVGEFINDKYLEITDWKNE